ncbi:hypothetical protein [Aquimonas voraii]|uniref:Uncharacterized protein n=1 Tax=Aquimonas voraii TaxID=265719 RepID=A0A1G6UQJ5_9GAMM|nr:hypothetical protein [Aquimonas voraii]SDD43612.1 hypothetical protein SAMN04488509_102447 [Aquimonas voraii]
MHKRPLNSMPSQPTPAPQQRIRGRATACSRAHGHLALLTGLIALLGLGACESRANSQGSPICEVNSLPLVPMSPTLASPPPQGWTLVAPARFYPGLPLQLRLQHPDPLRRARGVLLWAKANASQGAGSFTVPGNGRWAYIPAPATCGTWALSHTDNQAKTQAELVFEWTGEASPSAILRAFLIEDCNNPAGCRDQQALTQIVFLEAGVFANGFEP